MDLEQFVESWKFKFDEEPPGWIRHMTEPDTEIEDCQSRIKDLMDSLRKEEFLLVYLRQQVRAQSRRSLRESSQSPEIAVSDSDESTEIVGDSHFGSSETLEGHSGKSTDDILVHDPNTLRDIAQDLVQEALTEARKNFSDEFLSREVQTVAISSASESDREADQSKSELASPGISEETYRGDKVSIPGETNVPEPSRPDSKLSLGKNQEFSEAFQNLDDMLAKHDVTPITSPDPGALALSKSSEVEVKSNSSLSTAASNDIKIEVTPTRHNGNLSSIPGRPKSASTPIRNISTSPRQSPVPLTKSSSHSIQLRQEVALNRDNTRKSSSDIEFLKKFTREGHVSQKRSSPTFRFQESEDVTLSLEILEDYESETGSGIDLEHAVLSDLSESASAFYSILSSPSLVSLEEADGKLQGKKISGSTGNLLDDADVDMQHFWEQNSQQNRARRKRSPYASVSSIEDGSHSIEENEALRKPSRLSAVFRTTVVEGETLVMRKLVVSGIVAAEKTYLTWLNILKENHRDPLLAIAKSPQAILKEETVRTIFYGVEELHDLHLKLCSQFEERARNWSPDVCIGDLFIILCKHLKLYRDYVEMYQKSAMTLKKSQQEVPRFNMFLEDAHEVVIKEIPDCPHTADLLRKPIERLQSYSLVLNDLCQHTPSDHSDYRILRESLKAMSDFIASTHDPTTFRELSIGYNKQLIKEATMVELVDGMRKVRHLLLFHDFLLCAKQKRNKDTAKLEFKWYISLPDLVFNPTDTNTVRQPVVATSDVQLSLLKSKIAELKAQIKGERSIDVTTTGSLGRKKGKSASKETKLLKKLNQLLAEYWVAQPSLPLRFFSKAGKSYVFVVHNEDIREDWIGMIKKHQPKANRVSLLPLELQDLLSKQKLKSQKDVSLIQTGDERDYLTGVLRVQVREAFGIKMATGLKIKPSLYCAVEVDEYGRLDRKARTNPVMLEHNKLVFDEGFEIDIDGAQKMRLLICVKQLLKEDVFARGSYLLPVPELRKGRRVKTSLKLQPQGSVELIFQYFTSHEVMMHKPALASSGVFCVPLDDVTRKEKHDIPLLVETCVQEIERRGMEEVGIYRVAGVMRDVDDLRKAFDTDYLKAQTLAADTDIHAVAGLLKKYFRELPDPLFTSFHYRSFIQGFMLQDPNARDQCLISLLHSLPLSHLKTCVYLFEHLKNVAENADENKMSLTNLATVFGPNLVRPGRREGSEVEATLNIMSQVGVLMYFLKLPSEMYDTLEWQRTSPSTLKQKLYGVCENKVAKEKTSNSKIKS